MNQRTSFYLKKINWRKLLLVPKVGSKRQNQASDWYTASNVAENHKRLMTLLFLMDILDEGEQIWTNSLPTTNILKAIFVIWTNETRTLGIDAHASLIYIEETFLWCPRG